MVATIAKHFHGKVVLKDQAYFGMYNDKPILDPTAFAVYSALSKPQLRKFYRMLDAIL
jgi:hypothetical protein